MSDLNTNFNVNPYYDDYDEGKDFYRMIFRPRIPVQARELTQLQTMQQKQVQRFGDHVFKDGSVVDGCHVSYRSPLKYVSVADQFYANTDLSVSSFDSTYLLVGNTSGVRAVIAATKSGFEATYPDSNRFYVDYVYTGESFSEFQRGEYIKVYGPAQDKLDELNSGNYVDQILVMDRTTSTGNGYGVSISDGVIYHKGFFSRAEAQTVIVKEFDTDPSGYRVGFDTTEEIVTEDQDDSLLDNALGYPNYNAPGAHRLKLVPILVAKTRTETVDATNFFAVVEFDGTTPTEQHSDASYNLLGDEMAKRTSEESGDYVVKPFTIETFPGYNANINGPDANLVSYSISTGIAYVKGYRVEKIGSSNVSVQRSYSESASEAQIVTANYGSYVVVDELMGHFDAKSLDTVIFYDAAQDTISDLEKASGARSGSIVGNATIRSLQYYSGTKGTPNCQYLAYLSDIKMANGKSFSVDVKSIYSNSSYGDSRADVVTTTSFYGNGSSYSTADLYDSSKKILVFKTGVDSMKSLNDNSGASDTQFVFTDVANATMQTNGFVSVSMNPAGPGGSERINASGLLTSLGEKQKFDVITTNDVLTTNLAGTASISSSSANVVGTGTAFSTDFTAGSFVKVFHQGGFDYRRVSSVTNSTHMVLSSNSSVSNALASYARLYPEGSHFDLSPSAANVNVTTNTTFTVSTGKAITNASTVMVTYQALKYNAYPMRKNVEKSIFVKIDCSTGGTTGPWNLGLADVYDVEAVYYGTSYSESNRDAKNWFVLDDGQRDEYYAHAKLEIKPEYTGKISGSTRLLVKLSRYAADASTGVGYFCVDSYPTSNTANSTTVSWAEIPTYRSKRVTYDLRNCVDFRPVKAATANSSTTAAGATVNPSNAAAGFISSTTGYLATPDSNFQADVSFYLPRRDVIVVNRSGDFSVVTGEPAEKPVLPLVSDDVMVIANAFVPAWPSLSTREAATYDRHDQKIRTNILTNPRYTMRDIGSLDQRVKRMEYYAVLNAVEQKARDFTVTDSSGLSRFKNGIFADPFNSHALGKVNDFEYKIAIDQESGVARPYFRKHKVDLKYSAGSSSTQRTGKSVTVPYSDEEFITQRFASKYRNCTESVWSWNGKLALYPSYDDYRDEKAMPNFNVSLDMSQPWEDFASSVFGSNYGEWRTKKTDRDVDSKTRVNGLTTTTSTTTTTTDTLTRIIDELKVDTMTNTYDLGSFVKDVTIEPYMRSRPISFVATNMKPNTVVHAFFDGVLVDDHCAPAEDAGVTEVEAGREDKILTRTGQWGSQLKTDSSGTVRGIFTIPPETFRVGDRTFALTDVDDLAVGGDAAVTRSEARFSASNVTTSTQGVTISTLEPDISVVQTKEKKTLVSSTTVVTTTTETTGGVNLEGGNGGGHDPIAQSFIIRVPNAESGLFVTKVSVYFKSKDRKLGVTAFVSETRVGLPNKSRIVGKSYMRSDEVVVSDDASSPTTFVFDEPLFLTAGETYAFMIKPDGDSPEYQIWMGETGGYDVTTGEQIYQNPYSGVAFVSSNMNTFTPLQKEDIKFKMFRANFSTGAYDASFRNEPDEFITFSGLQRTTTDVYVRVGDLVYTSNASNANQVFTGANTSQPFGVVQFIDEPEENLVIDSSTGGWAAGQTIQFHRPSSVSNSSLISANTRIALATIDSVDNKSYHAVVPRFSILKPARTSASLFFKGTKSPNTADPNWVSVVNDREHEFLDTTRLAKSYSNESSASSNYKVTLSTESRYVSPVINLARKSTYFVENLINDDDTKEANTRYGSAMSKYVSGNVVLADGQDAEDVLVTVAAYRPSGTDVKVYVKLLNAEDGEDFDSKAWTELELNSGSGTYSNPKDQKDFIDFEYSIPSSAPASNPTAAYLESSTGICTYTRTDGAKLYGYKTFSLKICLFSSNAARVPTLSDVRLICLQA